MKCKEYNYFNNHVSDNDNGSINCHLDKSADVLQLQSSVLCHSILSYINDTNAEHQKVSVSLGVHNRDKHLHPQKLPNPTPIQLHTFVSYGLP